MNLKQDLTGEKFGRLLVIGFAYKDKWGKNYWECKCSCKDYKDCAQSELRKGAIKSCGCLALDSKQTHGMTNTSEYNIRMSMISRCNNKNNDNYKNYGGRGIKVCERWLESFENFYEDMGDKPSERHSIERLDNDKGYCKENCIWATWREQANNRRNPTKLFKGAYSKRSKFVARITEENKKYHLGIFDTIEEAATAYDEACEYFGDARPNQTTSNKDIRIKVIKRIHILELQE